MPRASTTRLLLAMRAALLTAMVLPASATPTLGLRDAIEVVDFFARATLVLPSGETQPNAEVRAGTIRPGPITLHLRMKRNGRSTESFVEWRMYRFPQTPSSFDTGLHAVAIQANGSAAAGAVVQIQQGAHEIRALADPNNRFGEVKAALENNRRSILLIVVPPQS